MEDDDHVARPAPLPEIDRRRFLQLAAGGALTATGVFGCGGGGKRGGGGRISDAVRYATFDGVHTFVAGLPGSDGDQRRQAILDYLRTRPEFEAAGASGDGSLWARFTDNRLYVLIANESDFGRSRSLPIPDGLTRAAPAELPVPVNARIVMGLGPAETNQNATIKSLLSQRGYTVLNTTASIYDLKLVFGDGVFYILAHGGNGYNRANQAVFGVTSATVASPTDDQRLADDWAHQRIGYADVYDTLYGFFNDPKTYYLFTEQFVKDYMHFGSNSVVFVGACNSASDNHRSFHKAFRDNGAGVFAGWSHNTQRRHNIAAALYFFDRMLGANAAGPDETPDQRPFDYAALKADMTRKGLDRSDAAELVFYTGTTGESGLLAPSLKYMDMNELEDTLILTGKFGTRPTGNAAKVTVGGFPQTIKTWQKEKIEVTIPVSGNGSVGDVIVYSGQRKSNPRRLSEWKPVFTVRQQGDGREQWIGPLNIRFRADVGSYRERPGDAPQYRDKIPFRATRDITGRWVASGQYDYPNSNGEWQRWKDAADLVNGEFDPAADNTIVCYGEIRPTQGKIRMALAAESMAGMMVVDSFGGEDVLIGTTGLLKEPYSATDETPCLILDLNSDLGIMGDTNITTPAGYQLKTTWVDANPSPPVNDSDARSVALSRVKQ